ncbi:polar amino acid transport system substrate-binding protein [Inhella inkyongensis]|uniref:Polar amino acid transport system substrate-binding protein n=1 Tax=Inhella inkyongensis TaxID=392593 RepID=A0A840S9Q6_9BURK|nr:transporter substrate-binding domain-containing protein [Inhella inkyongensis]MBB5205139.1 polar amino acid transport system substrate-binding protein [Inhella inkyongensis]
MFRALMVGLLGLWVGCAQAEAVLKVVRGELDFPPFEMQQEGREAGLHIELVEAAAARAGLKVQWQRLPWKRALRELELGQADAATYVSRTPEREAWAIFLDDNRLSSTELRFVVRREQAERIRFDGDLPRFLGSIRKPIAIRGFQFGVPAVDQVKKLEARNLDDLLRLLHEGAADVAVLNWTDFQGSYGGRPEAQAVQGLSPPIQRMHNYLAFSKVRAATGLAQRMAEALVAYRRTPEYQALLKRYRVDAP